MAQKQMEIKILLIGSTSEEIHKDNHHYLFSLCTVNKIDKKLLYKTVPNIPTVDDAMGVSGN